MSYLLGILIQGLLPVMYRETRVRVCIPDAACSIVRLNSNFASWLRSGRSSVGLQLGEALEGGELPVEEKLVDRFRIWILGRVPPIMFTGIGWLRLDITGCGLSLRRWLCFGFLFSCIREITDSLQSREPAADSSVQWSNQQLQHPICNIKPTCLPSHEKSSSLWRVGTAIPNSMGSTHQMIIHQNSKHCMDNQRVISYFLLAQHSMIGRLY